MVCPSKKLLITDSSDYNFLINETDREATVSFCRRNHEISSALANVFCLEGRAVQDLIFPYIKGIPKSPNIHNNLLRTTAKLPK